MKNIPLTKPDVATEEALAVAEVIKSGWLTQGPKVSEFEANFSRYVGTKYAVAVSNCTTALHLALIIAGIKSGDEVICPSLSFIATANAIKYVGAIPVFADVDPNTYNIDFRSAEKLITKKTKAILLVHQLGLPADIEAFRKLGKKYNLRIIEDAACASGSEYKNKRIGSHSELVCFSFHPRKVITTAEGGMITTSNSSYYERLMRLRQHGMSVSDLVRHKTKRLVFEDFSEIGYNYRLSDVHAAIGLSQLKKINKIIKKRREIAEQYNRSFEKIKTLNIPLEPTGIRTNYQTYMICLKDNFPLSRENFMTELKKRNISVRSGVMAIHKSAAYYKDYQKIKLPVTDKISNSSVILPLYPKMTAKEINYVINSVLDLAR